MGNCKAQETTLCADGAIIVKGRIWVSQVDGLIQIFLVESHSS